MDEARGVVTVDILGTIFGPGILRPLAVIHNAKGKTRSNSFILKTSGSERLRVCRSDKELKVFESWKLGNMYAEVPRFK